MHEHDKHFLLCLEKERELFAAEIQRLSREPWPALPLIKRIKRLLAQKPELADDLGHLTGVIAFLKAAARGNPFAEPLRRVLVRELVRTDTFEAASRRVLKNWIAEWALQDMRWPRVPIRFYYGDNAMVPCLLPDGVLLHYKDVPNRAVHYPFDATWLWNDYCVYAWHRWADAPVDTAYLQEMMAACAKATLSIYKDKTPCFLLILHGPYATGVQAQLPAVPNVRVISPWEITRALESMQLG